MKYWWDLFYSLTKQKKFMKLIQATRQQVRIRLGIQGSAGSGKTLGALQVAYGLCADWTRIAVIDTEYGSASLYSHLGAYNVLSLSAPFSPERYIDAIRICEAAGMEVIIIDSMSQAWEGPGGILDIHNSMSGNSFTNWSKVVPRHSAMVQSILQSPCHVIVTIRSKQDYVLTTNAQGKTVPEKVGLKGVQREGLDYELTTLFEVDIKHNVTATKDRTSLFAGKPEFKLTPAVGQRLLDWCNQGAELDPKGNLIEKINNAVTVDELLKLYKNNPAYQVSLHEHFTKQRQRLNINRTAHELLHQQNQSSNGQHDLNAG
jgi:hypothetical protein